ncbi:MAG: hypothetical protein ACT4PM_05550 [Gemmatimonadales bacterium]
MPLHPLFGHEQTRKRASLALRSGRLPQVLLLTGADGIGKQRFGLWLAQLLLCEQPLEEPCGRCRSCRLVLGLGHPDLHWFVPIPRPKSSEADRQIEEAEELLGEVIAGRRERSLYEPSDGMAFHPLASIRLLLRRAALTSVEGGKKVFVLGNASQLVPQESSPEAANALLKFLEEPPTDTWVILTTTEAERVLPTIRSRAAAVRLTPVSDSAVREFVEQVLQAPSAARDRLVRRAEGTIGRLAATEGEGEGEEGRALEDRATRAEREARALLAAIRKPGPAGLGERLERALRQTPWAARGGFTDLLDALAVELVTEARKEAKGQRVRQSERVRSAATGLQRIAQAREEAQGNVNPQLLLADLAAELAEAG